MNKLGNYVITVVFCLLAIGRLVAADGDLRRWLLAGDDGDTGGDWASLVATGASGAMAGAGAASTASVSTLAVTFDDEHAAFAWTSADKRIAAKMKAYQVAFPLEFNIIACILQPGSWRRFVAALPHQDVGYVLWRIFDHSFLLGRALQSVFGPVLAGVLGVEVGDPLPASGLRMVQELLVENKYPAVGAWRVREVPPSRLRRGLASALAWVRPQRALSNQEERMKLILRQLAAENPNKFNFFVAIVTMAEDEEWLDPSDPETLLDCKGLLCEITPDDIEVIFPGLLREMLGNKLCRAHGVVADAPVPEEMRRLLRLLLVPNEHPGVGAWYVAGDV